MTASDVSTRPDPGLGLVYGACVAALAPIYLVVPALPRIAEALDLSNADLALLMSAFMVPAALSALPIGVLADRFGRRDLMTISLLLLGAGGLGAALFPTFPAMVAFRVVQGVGYGGIQTMSITLIGDLRRGRAMAEAQGMRSVAIAVAGAGLPVVGGLLVTTGWRAVFLAQGACIIIGMLTHLSLPEGTPATHPVDPATHRPGRRGSAARHVGGVLREPLVLTLVGAGLFRFCLKYGFITFLPVLYVSLHGNDSVAIGYLLGAASACGVGGALVVRRLLGRHAASRLLVASTVGTGVGLLLVGGLGEALHLLVVGTLVFGLCDAMSSVCQNALIAVATHERVRGTAVALAATGRNTGKSLGPIVVGGLALTMSLGAIMVSLGLLSVAVAFAIHPTRRLDHHLVAPPLERVPLQE